MLACFKYFPGCPRPRLTEAKKVKGAEDDLATGVFIWDVSTRLSSVWSASG